jgi:amino acid adenylation domain-containing protein
MFITMSGQKTGIQDVRRRMIGFPESQQAVHDKCTHPTGIFVEFKQEEIGQSIPERFEQQVRTYPHRLAIEAAGQQLSYTALNETANRVAWAIITALKGRDKPIAILLGLGPQIIATMLGVLKAGHFYVTLDPSYPLARLSYMLEDSQAVLLITNAQHLPLAHELAPSGSHVLNIDHLPAYLSAENPCLSIDPDGLACLIYTSGSTGQPKGVMHTHRTVLHMTMVATNTLHTSAEDRLVLLYSPSFLATTRLIFLAGLNGAALFPFNVKAEGLTHFGSWLTQKGITFYCSFPTLFRHFVRTLRDEKAFPSVRLIWLSGEPVEPKDVALYRKHFSSDCLFIHGFGATETGPVLDYFVDMKMQLPDVNLPLGYVAEGAEVLLLDENGAEVGNNRMGEIAVKSRYLALGYWRQPELTQAVFRPDPSGGEARIYLTGDLGRRLPDGCLEHLGRKDWQVKIRGHRIEVVEVERALLEMPAVAEAVVMSREFQERDTRLVAYFVPAKDSGVTVNEIRRFLQAKLPGYMVPSAFVQLHALPLTPSGKIDRRALPSPNQARPVLEEPFVAPHTPIEQQVAASWSDLLGLERVGIHDNFFELGGHSLLATQLVSRLCEAMNVEISLRSFFETPTVAGLASSINTALQGEQGQQATAIMPVLREQALPASIAQEQIWIVDQVFQGLPLFNILYAMRLQGMCHVAILQQSCDEIVRRHEALRTTFATVEGRLVQVIAPTMSVPVMVVDLRALPTPERESEAQRLADAEARQPFDLEQGPLLRLRLVYMDEQEHLLLVTMHHSIGDGWSFGVLAHELAVLYDAFSVNEPSPLPELRIQYADFAHWQRQWRNNVVMTAQLAYWQEQLRDPLSALELPTDHPRGAALSFRTARQTLGLPGQLSEALRGLSHRHGSTLFMTLVAAFKMLLYGYTGQEDLRVATLIANRNRRETEEVIGLFVNMVILRTDLRGDPTCGEVLQRVRATTLAAYAHQDLPFEDLVQTLERERGLKRSSLCQVMFILQNAMQRPLQRSARTLSFLETDLSIQMPLHVGTTFDVVLSLRERPQGLTVSAIYKQNLFDATTVARMLGDFQHVLECLIGELEQPLSTFRSLGGDRSRGA